MDATLKQRRNEIQEKKAKLAELKRQRELRQREFIATRQSIGESSDVRFETPLSTPLANVRVRSLHQLLAEPKTDENSIA